MSYEPRLIAAHVRQRLTDQPLTTLAVIAAELDVDRHTISSALKRTDDGSFRSIQLQCLQGAIEQQLAMPLTRPLSAIATGIGYSSVRALATRVRAMYGCSPTELRRRLAK